MRMHTATLWIVFGVALAASDARGQRVEVRTEDGLRLLLSAEGRAGGDQRMTLDLRADGPQRGRRRLTTGLR